MNEIYQNMLSAYDLSTDQAKRNATFEVNQQIILAGLYQGGFFEKAAFYGGTCLRIFHGLNRFSEDMACFLIGDRLPTKAHLAVFRLQNAVQMQKQRRFSGAVCTQDRCCLTLFKCNGQIFNGATLFVIAICQMLCL